jgi:hypothetical protein
VRRSTTDLRARVNGDLPLEFRDVALTSYAGLELFNRYLRTIGFNATVRDGCGSVPHDYDLEHETNRDDRMPSDAFANDACTRWPPGPCSPRAQDVLGRRSHDAVDHVAARPS